MISKVKSISWTKPRTGQNGTVYFHNLEMENGDKCNIGKKSDNFFKVWDEINYEVVSTDEYGTKKIKEIKPEFVPGWKKEGFSKNYPADAVTMCLSYAKDLAVAGKIEVVDIDTQAEIMYKRVLKTLIFQPN